MLLLTPQQYHFGPHPFAASPAHCRAAAPSNHSLPQQHVLMRLSSRQKALPCGADLLIAGGGGSSSHPSLLLTLSISIWQLAANPIKAVRYLKPSATPYKNEGMDAGNVHMKLVASNRKQGSYWDKLLEFTKAGIGISSFIKGFCPYSIDQHRILAEEQVTRKLRVKLPVYFLSGTREQNSWVAHHAWHFLTST